MIKIFIDSGNVDEIREACSLGVVSGATVNLSLAQKEILRQGNKCTYDKIVREICDIVKGPVSFQVTGRKTEEMVKQARKLVEIAPNVVVKVPITMEGLKTIGTLSKEGIKVNTTLCYTLNQALLAALNGAAYVSFLAGRLDKIGYDGVELVKDIRDVFDVHEIPTKIIFAAVRHPLHVSEAAKAGVHIVTVGYSILLDLVEHPLTDVGFEDFLADWEKVPRELRGVLGE